MLRSGIDVKEKSMNNLTRTTNPDQNAKEQILPMLQEAGLGASASAPEAAIEQIVAEKQSEADSQAYVFIP
jgi:4-hydroxy-3-methylbut-2-enyl diphosphate reductase IspH